jgi:hypothetical protein
MPNKYCWELDTPIDFSTPIAYSGKQRLWNVPAELEAAIKIGQSVDVALESLSHSLIAVVQAIRTALPL